MTDFEDDWALLRPSLPRRDPVRDSVQEPSPKWLGPLDPYALVALDHRGNPRGPFLLLLEDGEGNLLHLQVPLRQERGTLVGSLFLPRSVEVFTGVLLFGGRDGIRVQLWPEARALLAGDTLHVSLPLDNWF